MQSAFPITDKWGVIRQIYMEKMPEIWEASELNPLGQTDPYFVDWAVEFTPIEEQAWHSIRSQGVPLYCKLPLPSQKIGRIDNMRPAHWVAQFRS